ncbi:MAG TPA: class I SAM-dependent methyltransferase [Bryobacteraceae bacterium]|nr:class I SAM-dependent methyltransferase [Bryobacteraceae bacterium]
MTEAAPAASFRDPNGAVFGSRGRTFRILNAAGVDESRAFLASPIAAKWAASGRLIPATMLDRGAQSTLLEDPRAAELFARINGNAILEHDRIPFPSFPYEWPPEMLHAAARLTLDLAIDLLPEHFGLKDATPYNVLFRGPDPVFVDLLSIERRAPGDPIWLAYAQFVRTFLLPLAANRHLGIALDQLLFTRRDGIEPEEVYGWLGPLQRLRRPFLSLVSLPVWLKRLDDASIYRQKLLPDAERAQFILRSLLKRLRRTLVSPTPKPAASSWTGYMQAGNNNYSAEKFQAKDRFLAECLAHYSPQRVLDVGCNTGHFSLMAARSDASVVAIDYDPAVVGALWRKSAAERLNVLPLVVNLARPTPAAGWRNREWPSFLDRARGHFDAVLMLAIIHHLLVTERIPLDEIVDLAAELTTGLLVIEFVSPEDSMFRRLVRGREELYRHLTPQAFERSCQRRFEIVRTQHLESETRWLYVMRRRSE